MTRCKLAIRKMYTFLYIFAYKPENVSYGFVKGVLLISQNVKIILYL